jgi:hypothetical protein
MGASLNAQPSDAELKLQLLGYLETWVGCNPPQSASIRAADAITNRP